MGLNFRLTIIGLGAGIGLVASEPVMAADPDPELDALRSEVRELRSLVTALQTRLAEIEGREPASEASQSEPIAQPAEPPRNDDARLAWTMTTTSQRLGVGRSPLPPRETVGDRITGASRIDNQAPPNDPELRGFIPIPGTETMVRIGGFAKVDMIWDPAFVGNSDQFAVPATSFGRIDRNRATVNARATRFSLEVRRPSALGDLRFYVENDFHGSGSSYGFNLHHAYGQVGNTYGGFGYSALVDADALPDTLDDWGPGGAVFLRTASARQAFKIAPGAHLTLSVERPESDVSLTGDQSGASTMPDIVLVGRYESAAGHIQLGGVVRRIGYRDEERRADDITGFGLSASGSLALFERDGLAFAVNYGRGAARYVNDLNGLGLDAVIRPDGELALIEHIGGYGAYTHHWTGNVRSNLVFGALRLSDAEWLDPTAMRESRYGALNVIWSPASSFSLGLEGLYGRLERQDGRSRDSSRIQATLKYDFVR